MARKIVKSNQACEKFYERIVVRGFRWGLKRKARLVVKRMHNHNIEAVILTGEGAGQTALIPRIPIINSATDVPIPFRRRQFPLRVSFFLSLNKGQGQSFKCVGLDLLRHVFSHGKLYVGASCVGCSEALYILTPDGRTKNTVARKALQWHPVLCVSNSSIRSFLGPYNVMWKFAYWDNYSVIFS